MVNLFGANSPIDALPEQKSGDSEYFCDEPLCLKKSAQLSLLANSTNFITYPVSLVQKLCLVGFEPAPAKFIHSVSNAATYTHYPNTFSLIKTFKDVNGIRFVYSGFLFDTCTYYLKTTAEYYLTNRTDIYGRYKNSLFAEKGESFRQKWYHQILKWLSKNLCWILPDIVFYPTTVILNRYTVDLLSKTKPSLSLIKTVMQIAKNDGMRGFYYGFAAFMIFEFLWRSIAEKSVDAVNKFIPEKNQTQTEVQSFFIDQFAQIAVGIFRSASVLQSVNSPCHLVSHDPLVSRCTNLFSACNALTSSDFNYRFSMFSRIKVLDHKSALAV